MSRICGACKKPIRADESLATAYCDGAGGPGYYQACPRCCAASEGVDPPAPRKYPASEVHDVRGLPFSICGLCREAMFHGEAYSTVRITNEDVGEGATAPGVYRMCPRCAGHWRPIVVSRWLREGIIRSADAAPEPLV